MQRFQVSFIGLSTLFGKTSSLLLKQSPFIKCIKLYDESNIDPALDVAGMNTQCKVKAFLGKEQLKSALKNADIIVIGEDAYSETCSDDLFSATAPKVLDYAKAIATTAPEAIVVVAASPVNSMMPLLTEMLVHQGCYNNNKVMGATTLDNVRANSLLASHLKIDAQNVVLPVIGGCSEETRVPVFSQAKPKTHLSQEIKESLTNDIKTCDSEIMRYKNSPESLNKAYATMRFLNSIMAGLRGETNVTDITLTKTNVVPGVEYFALPVVFGRDGIVQRYGIPALSLMEQEMVNNAITHMKKDADKASSFWKEGSYIAKQFAMSPENRRTKEALDFCRNFNQTKVIKKVESLYPQNEYDTTATLSESEKYNSSKETITNPKENVLSGFVYQSKRKINSNFEEPGDGPISFRPVSNSASLNICQPLQCPIEIATKQEKIPLYSTKKIYEGTSNQFESNGIDFSNENDYTMNRNSRKESKSSSLRDYKKQMGKSRDIQAQADHEQNLAELVENTERIVNESIKFTLGTKKMKDNKKLINSQPSSDTKNGSKVKQETLLQQISSKSNQSYNNDINIINKTKADKSSGKKEKRESANPDVLGYESSYMHGISDFAKQIRNQYHKFALNKQKAQGKVMNDIVHAKTRIKAMPFPQQQLKSQQKRLKIFEGKKQPTNLPFPQPHQYGVNKKLASKGLEANKNLPFFDKLYESNNSMPSFSDKKPIPIKLKKDHTRVLKKKDSLLQAKSTIDEIEKPLRDYISIKSFFAKSKDNSEKSLAKGRSVNKIEKVSLKRENSDPGKQMLDVAEAAKAHEQTIVKEMKAQTSGSPKHKRTNEKTLQWDRHRSEKNANDAEQTKDKERKVIEEKLKSEDFERKKPAVDKSIFGKLTNNLTRFSVAARPKKEKLTLRDQAKVYALQDLNKKTNTQVKMHLNYKLKSSASQQWDRHRSEKIANDNGKKVTPELESLKSTTNGKSKPINIIPEKADEIVIKEDSKPKIKSLFQVLSANKTVKENDLANKQKEIETKVEINDEKLAIAKDLTVVENSISTAPLKSLLQMLPNKRTHYVNKSNKNEYLKKEEKPIDSVTTNETVRINNRTEARALEANARKQAKLIQDHLVRHSHFQQQYLQQKYSEENKQNLKVKGPTYKMLPPNKVINISEDSKRLDSDNDSLKESNTTVDTTSKHSPEHVNVPPNQKIGYNDLKKLVKNKVSTLQKPVKNSAELSNSTQLPQDQKPKEPDIIIKETIPTNDVVIINKSEAKAEEKGEKSDLNQSQNDVKITLKPQAEGNDSKLKSVLRHISEQKEQTVKYMKNNTISWKINEKMKLNYRRHSPTNKMVRNRINTTVRNLKYQKPLVHKLKSVQTKISPGVKMRPMQPLQGVNFYKFGSHTISEKEKRFRILNNFLSPNYLKKLHAEQFPTKGNQTSQKPTRVSVTVPLYGPKPLDQRRSKLAYKQKNKKKKVGSKLNQLKSNNSNKVNIKEDKPFIHLPQNIFEFDRSNIEKQKNLYLRPCKGQDVAKTGTSTDKFNPFRKIPAVGSLDSANLFLSLPNNSNKFKTPVGSLSFYKDFIKTSESKINEYNCKLGILPSLKTIFNESRV